MLILVSGGSASGKSEFAEGLAVKLGTTGKRYYIATMQPFDEECLHRIKRHQEMRSQKGFETIECYRDIQKLLLQKPFKEKPFQEKLLQEKHFQEKPFQEKPSQENLFQENLFSGQKQHTVLLECMSNLLANEMYGDRDSDAERGTDTGNAEDIVSGIVEQVLQLSRACEHLIIVTNEVFSDGRIYDETTMDYIRSLGKINCRLASEADLCVELFYTIPIYLKGNAI